MLSILLFWTSNLRYRSVSVAVYEDPLMTFFPYLIVTVAKVGVM